MYEALGDAYHAVEHLPSSAKRRRLDESGRAAPLVFQPTLTPASLSPLSFHTHSSNRSPRSTYDSEVYHSPCSGYQSLTSPIPDGSSACISQDAWPGTDYSEAARGDQRCSSGNGTEIEGSEHAKGNGIGQVCFGMLKDLAVTVLGNTLASGILPFTPVSAQASSVSLRSAPDVTIGTVAPLVAHVLSTLEAQDGLELQLYCNGTTRGSKRSSTAHTNICAIIYGLPEQADAVGEFLQDCNTYLQNPQHCDRNVEYRNPQSLSQETSMTQEKEAKVALDFKVFRNPIDVLADLEYEDHLPETRTPSALKTELFGHQMQALTFMRRREQGWAFLGPQPDLWRLDASHPHAPTYVNTITDERHLNPPTDFRGGVLADQMGLGKSLSIIALVASDRDDVDHPTGSPLFQTQAKPTLLVVRAALLNTWETQLQSHVHTGALTWQLHYGNKRAKDPAQLMSADVVITTYQTLVAEWKKHRTLPQLMFTTVWHRLVLDEAHDIRDGSRMTARAICALESTRRWALTGTPIQNRLSDLASLYHLLRVQPYNDPKTFISTVGRLCHDTTDETGISKLKQMIRCIMLRRSIATVNLPERHDMVCKLDFAPEELKMYNDAKSYTQALLDDFRCSGTSGTQVNVLSWINNLLRICNLGITAKLSGLGRQTAWDDRAAQDIFDGLVISGSAVCFACSNDLGAVATEFADKASDIKFRPHLSKCLRLICGPCIEKTENSFACQHTPSCPISAVSMLSSTTQAIDDSSMAAEYTPTKVKALIQDIGAHYDQEQSVVFSFWTSMLDAIEKALKRVGIGFVRVDGNVPSKGRTAALESFREDNSVRVALITISCGAVGLDLTSASRAYLMEPHWNPSVEQQALARVYRMGQKRPVTTIRYIMRNSFEEHVINVQNRKQLLTEFLLSHEQESGGRSSAQRIEHLWTLLQGESAGT